MRLKNEEIQEMRAERLSTLLKTYKMSQADLVKKSEGRIQASNLCSWIKGAKTITESTIETIAEFFPEINVQWLLCRSDYMMKADADKVSELMDTTSKRVICPLELLQSSFDLVNSQLGTEVDCNIREEAEELMDRLVSYSDFLVFEYIKKRQS